MLDTSVAIHLRDGDQAVRDRIFDLHDALLLSVISRVELEGGLHGADEQPRRNRMEAMFSVVDVLPFGDGEAKVYGEMLNVVGFSRRKVIDRMIAAQAIAAGASLVTLNGADFRDIPGLSLIEW